MKKIDSNFNPSPFDDNEGENSNQNKEKEISKEEKELFKLLSEIAGHGVILTPIPVPKFNEIPLTVVFQVDIENRDIFQATLTREKHYTILGFLFDWLVERKCLEETSQVTKPVWIATTWQHRFENLFI